MPDDLDVLPKPDTLEGVLHCCSVAGGDTPPLPPHSQWDDHSLHEDLEANNYENWEERAGILEFDGGLERNEAEQRARRMVFDK